jgi:hypothetical protein
MSLVFTGLFGSGFAGLGWIMRNQVDLLRRDFYPSRYFGKYLRRFVADPVKADGPDLSCKILPIGHRHSRQKFRLTERIRASCARSYTCFGFGAAGRRFYSCGLWRLRSHLVHHPAKNVRWGELLPHLPSEGYWVADSSTYNGPICTHCCE